MLDRDKEFLKNFIRSRNGILYLEPAWVARDFLAPGKRLGLREDEYELGERGAICERWLASVTKADNRVGPVDEGLSYLAVPDGAQITLSDATSVCPNLILGDEYAAGHKGLGRLIKIYDFAHRIPYHFHQMENDAHAVGRNSKDEAYYFLEDVDMGIHPETFFGVHPYLVREKKYDLLLPYLREWNSDLILHHSRAYLNVPGEGFFLPSGILHAPGTALTLELQEDSDIGCFMQALSGGNIIRKELLYQHILPELWQRKHEEAVLELLDWEENGDPYFYENHHLTPLSIEKQNIDGAREYWVFYNTRKFSGKKVEIEPGASITATERGVFSIFVWKGIGEIDGNQIEGGVPGKDELLICHERAVRPLEIRNVGREILKLFKFFGPDINSDFPRLPRYTS